MEKKKEKIKVIELDINEALSIEKRLKSISAGDVLKVSEEDEKIFQMAAQLINTLTSIHGMWSTSKKKINRLLKMVFGNRSEKLKDLKPLPKNVDGNSNNQNNNTQKRYR